MKARTILTGIIGGGNFSNLDVLKKKKLRTISTPYGKAFYYFIKNCPIILRHGPKKNIPPHKINYKANISALKKLGVKSIFSFNSVGSLKKRLKPGTFFIPSDYINFSDSITFYDKKCRFITPEISKRIIKILEKISKNLKLKFKSGGVYFGTIGPRLETKAEIIMIRNFADVVGMTMSKEATLADELGLEYASLCAIDNFANGLVKKPLTQEEIEKNRRKTDNIIAKIVNEILSLKV
jgi:5'-methylthioadenosine phosphorylase